MFLFLLMVEFILTTKPPEEDAKGGSSSRNNLTAYALPVIASVIIGVTVILLLVILVAYKPETKPSLNTEDRIECPGLNEENCASKGCQWEVMKNRPSCYMEKNSFGYEINEVAEKDNGTEIKLSNLTLNTPYGESIHSVIFNVVYISKNIVRFQFKDALKERYEVPIQKDFPLLQNLPNVKKADIKYEIQYDKEGVFYFSVNRINGTTLWDTRIGGLLLSDQYLQIASILPNSNIYGLGEHVHGTLKHKMDYVSWPMFARDRFPSSHANQHNLYGVHPFYTCLEDDGKSHGVLFLNSNAMEVTLMPKPAISFRTIGGILDFFIFIGDNPEHVIQLYTSLIGRPMLPPYWSLGFQLCRYGYNGLQYLEDVINRTYNARIPQAVQFLDIDHMSESKDFTYDNESFANLPEFMKKEQEDKHLKWIIILDPAIAIIPDYKPWTSGLKKEVFVRKAENWSKSMFPESVKGYSITFGKVWPLAYTAFPDFFQESTKKWWKENIVEHWKNNKIIFDGLWIDMNEPANFETNVENPSFCEEKGFNEKDCKALICPESPFEDPPYNPLKEITGDRLSEKTICMESEHSINGAKYRHYDVHSLYGWSQSQPTLEAAQEATGTRSLVISRSTFPSSGRHTGHWLGDNTSDYPDMKNSIIGMLEFNLFGIPYVGADVCGFIGKANKDLCKRWMQLGAFYPFYRNHNAINEEPQDPAYFGKDVAEASRKAVERRNTLNPYLYTLFYRAHVDGNTVVRPVFHEFPDDKIARDIDEAFMWGKSLLIAPILEENRKSLSVYLPKGEWWHFYYENSSLQKNSETWIIETDADEYTPLFVRGGTILPLAVYDWDSYPEEDNVTTRTIDLYVFPENGAAEGELFMDDGISKDTVENKAYALYDFKLKDNNCTLEIASDEKKNFKGVEPHLNKIFIFKVMEAEKNSGNYTFTVNKELNILAVTVDTKMSKLKELTWEDADGKCSMLE